jgi:nitroreductase
MKILNDDGKNLLFLQARTYHQWQEKEVEDATLHHLYELMKWAPTSTNTSPARLYFIKSLQEKEKLLACLMPGNIPQTQGAPVTAIIAYDLDFYKNLDYLSPANKARTWFEGNTEKCQTTAYLNSAIQGGYFILAARACGLDCGPMSGFSTDKIDEAFFAGTSLKSLFLCNLGYGHPEGIHPRAPRLSFEEACCIL